MKKYIIKSLEELEDTETKKCNMADIDIFVSWSLQALVNKINEALSETTMQVDKNTIKTGLHLKNTKLEYQHLDRVNVYGLFDLPATYGSNTHKALLKMYHRLPCTDRELAKLDALQLITFFGYKRVLSPEGENLLASLRGTETRTDAKTLKTILKLIRIARTRKGVVDESYKEPIIDHLIQHSWLEYINDSRNYQTYKVCIDDTFLAKHIPKLKHVPFSLLPTYVSFLPIDQLPKYLTYEDVQIRKAAQKRVVELQT